MSQYKVDHASLPVGQAWLVKRLSVKLHNRKLLPRKPHAPSHLQMAS